MKSRRRASSTTSTSTELRTAFFSNLGEPVNAVNNLLQGKPGNAVSDVGRFAMNSVLGILGNWLDPQRMELETAQ